MKDFSQKYLDYLTGPLAGLNLTRILSPDEFYHKQVLDSVGPLDNQWFYRTIQEAGLLVDVGFGGGFPLLPLAYRMPEVSFLGFEARRKKVDAVNEIADHLALKNVKCYHHRLETVLFDRPTVITLKAVGKIPEILSKIHSSVPITVIFYKGPQVEKQEVINDFSEDWKLVEDFFYEVKGTEARRILAYQTINQNVPRGTFNVTSLVKVSDLL